MFPISEFFSKCDQIRSFQRIWSHLLKKSLMENFFFCAVSGVVSSSDLNHNWQKYDPYILQLNT